jgi:hypothetical protein
MDGVAMSRILLSLAMLDFVVAGCAAEPAARSPNAPERSAPAAERTGVADAAEPAAKPDALAYTTTAYAQTMQEQLAKLGGARQADTHPQQQAARAQAAPRQVDPAVPKVEWLESKDFHLTLGPPQGAEGSERPTAAVTTIQAQAPMPAAATAPTPPDAQQAKAPVQLAVMPSPVGNDELSRRLAQQVREDARGLASHLDWQLLQFLEGKQVPQMEAIASLTPEDREILSALMDALANLRAAARADDNAMMVKKVLPLLEMADRLRAQADLHIPAVALCTRVAAFGVYDPVDSTQLAVGKEHQLILYCEIENFASQYNEKRLWLTQLTHEAVLYDERGKRIWETKREKVEDVSRNRRHDFFINQKVRFPATLAAGNYYLKVSINDQQANRGAQATLPVQVVSR